MTYNQVITLFSNIAAAHKQIKAFGTGELWEVEGNIKPGIIYPMLYIVPVNSGTLENTKVRTFTALVFGQVKKDKSNEQEILSDCESIGDDIVKILRNESNDYDLLGDPQLIPFKEDMGDFVTGWRFDFDLQTDFANNYCDVPSDEFISPIASSFKVFIKDQDGNVIATLNPGSVYYVTILSTIQEALTANNIIIENLT